MPGKTTVTIHVAKSTLSQLVARAEAGEEIIIARDKTPVAKLVPLAAHAPKRQAGTMKGKIALDAAFFEPLPEDELAAWQ
ncbi:MAG TPA: type II toxin-antitoxin system prevent-host-death family antitoxin [Stellaceae bacterium]|nr:type II toxin-antitoxin system prevent-host-death family antitoxin [Stellaceae bacterium]